MFLITILTKVPFSLLELLGVNGPYKLHLGLQAIDTSVKITGTKGGSIYKCSLTLIDKEFQVLYDSDVFIHLKNQ